MKKILSLALVLVMVLSVAALVGCTGDKEPAGNDAAATLKFGLGVVSNFGEATDADGDTNGAGEFNTTAVAVLLDAEGKIAAIDLDTAQIKTAWTSAGKVIAVEDLRTKYEKGTEYNMAAFGKKHDGSEGKPLEWNEQADVFMTTAKGKTLAEVKALMAEDGYAQGDLATAGCTIKVGDFMSALEKAVNSAADSKATAENKLAVALVAANSHSSADATDEKEGLAQIDTTVVAAVTDAEGKVVVSKTDCVQGKMPFDAAGKSTLDATAAIKTKLELGDDYNMAKFGTRHDGTEGEVKEWYAQAAAFDAALVGKTAADFAGLAGDDGYATGDLATAGCTMAIGDMIAAATAATK
ncbi:MAG: hypothetical protein E7557_05125 [Ruminococcaceae bacterium]|nr:hypothetical protein [Oscillospiraceae bacterium]